MAILSSTGESSLTDQEPALCLRRLARADLPAAQEIQAQTYPPFLREGEEAFASRLDVAAPYCLAATRDGALVGYLLAHGWPSQSPPAPGTLLARNAPSEVLFIHDLAIGSGGQGRGIGRKLVARALELAAGDGLRAAELIAVEGAASYWQTLGFAEGRVERALSAQVAAYGADARWMTKRIAPIGASPATPGAKCQPCGAERFWRNIVRTRSDRILVMRTAAS